MVKGDGFFVDPLYTVYFSFGGKLVTNLILHNATLISFQTPDMSDGLEIIDPVGKCLESEYPVFELA